jgi:CAAX prenyl protease-like protein
MEPLHLIAKYFICYSLFLLLTCISKLNDGHKLFDAKGPVRNPGILAGLHIAGILWLGIIPISILDHSFLQVVFGKKYPGWWQWLALFPLLTITITIAYAQAAKYSFVNTAGNPLTLLNTPFVQKYFILRILFLVVYEAWFRGYLLTDSITWLGIPLAITLNISLYVLLHIFSGLKEMIACIPFGLALCGLAIWFGAAWPAIILHIAAAMMYETTLVKRFSNPVKVSV